ncbi:MAG: 50S ribosomal protein L25/general stress protein Ctc [Bacteroidetes bacterium]|nr:50S ribosomal protein L25/general stress protein Ctc [Bacteroidota bacterium]
MKQVSLSGSLRENVGKKDAKKHRKEGNVPCVMYGGKEQIHFVASDKAFRKLIFTPEVYIVNLEIAGKTYNTVIQDVQYHPVTDNILHIDFLEIQPEKPVNIGVPVKVIGTAPGVLKGGKLILKTRKLKILALMQHLPDEITVSIDPLDIGDSVKVKDLAVENITFMDSPNTIIVGVRTARVLVEETPGAEGASAEGAAPAEGAEKGKEGEGEKEKK